MRNLKSARMMVLKAFLFVVTGVMSAGLLLADAPSLKTAALICLAVWAFARAYYFAFHVIEKYIDPTFRFSGLFAAARYLASRRR